MTRLIFIRHAEVEKDQNTPAPLWGLSPKGNLTAAQTRDRLQKIKITALYSSTEQKSYDTAMPLAIYHDLPIAQKNNFDEVERPARYLSDSEFLIFKQRQFISPEDSSGLSESPLQALQRFREGVKMITEKHPNDAVAIVSHGTILSLYFSDLLGEMEQGFIRWQKIQFGSIGIVEKGEVFRDIISPLR